MTLLQASLSHSSYTFDVLQFETKRRHTRVVSTAPVSTIEPDPGHISAEVGQEEVPEPATNVAANEAQDDANIVAQANLEGTATTDPGNPAEEESKDSANNGSDPVRAIAEGQSQADGTIVPPESRDSTRPILDSTGEPVGSCFPQEALYVLGVVRINTKRVSEREEDIIKVRKVLEDDSRRLRAFLRSDYRTARALAKGLDLEAILAAWTIDDPAFNSHRTRWMHLSAVLRDLTAAHNDDEKDRTVLDKQAVDILRRMYKLWDDHPRVTAFQEKTDKKLAYQPISIPELEILSTKPTNIDGAPGKSDERTSEPTPSSITPSELLREQAETDEVRRNWKAARQELALAKLRFENWEDQRLYGAGHATSEAAQDHVRHGQTFVAALRTAEDAYEAAASRAQSLHAVSTRRLSNHFPVYGDSEIEAAWAEENEASKARTNYAGVERWTELLNRTSPEKGSPQSVPDEIAMLESIRFCESHTGVNQDRTRRIIAHHRQRNDEVLAGMLQDWPDDRILRPPPAQQLSDSSGPVSRVSKRKTRSDDSSTESWTSAVSSMKRQRRKDSAAIQTSSEQAVVEDLEDDDMVQSLREWMRCEIL